MTPSEAVLVVPFLSGGKLGYDLIVADSRASVHHYLDALNRAIEQLSLSCYRKNALPVQKELPPGSFKRFVAARSMEAGLCSESLKNDSRTCT